jgi:hypothetical protein
VSRLRWPTSEAELAAAIVAWLTDLHWEVYQEVQPVANYGSVADIVAVQGPLLWIIECKTSFSLKVIEQAYSWRTMAHYVSIAVPAPVRTERDFGAWILKQGGIGKIVAKKHTRGYEIEVREDLAPRLMRKARVDVIRSILTEEHKTYAQAGNHSSLRWTPFQETCRDLSFYVRSHPGCTLKEALGTVKTHYRSTATARSCLLQWGKDGVVRGVDFRHEDGTWRLYPNEEAAHRPAPVW